MSSAVGIEQLPDEVLEYILSLVPPYRDLHECMLVSKRWRLLVLRVARSKTRNLRRAIAEFDVKWIHQPTLANTSTSITISKRYSHTATIHENTMYVFGGCTSSMTTFNDLWKFDLGTRVWTRPLAMGAYPSPKACASLVCHNDRLILFGGWTYPPLYPHHQSWHLFNELHVYDIGANCWTSQTTTNTPPAMAGHSVSIVGDAMVVFGGIHKPNNVIHSEKSNDIWRLDLRTWIWSKPEVEAGKRPTKRLGQTQVVLDNENLLILGGSGGSTLSYYDAWVLNMNGDSWKWIEIDVDGKYFKPGNIWTNPGCKIGDKIVVLDRMRNNDCGTIVYYPKESWMGAERRNDAHDARIDLANREPDRDENVNGRRGVLRNKKEVDEEASRTNRAPIDSGPIRTLNLAAFSDTSTKYERRREQRLAHLSRVKIRLKRKEDVSEKKQHLGMYVLDIKDVLGPARRVTWLPPKSLINGPEETMLYTLLEGKSELVMFGGIRKDVLSTLGFSLNIGDQITNSLHFITANTYVI